MSVPQELRYAKSHEWVRDNGDGTATIGISSFAQDQLGDVVFWEGPEVGDTLTQAEVMGSVESVKAVSDVYAPISGDVLSNNEALEDQPELVNEDSYGKGWMVKIQLQDAAELKTLMDAAAYEAYVEAQD